MKEQITNNIIQKMQKLLNNEQLSLLQEVLEKELFGVTLTKESVHNNESIDYLSMFLSAKRVEGCSEKSLSYYESSIRNMLNSIDSDPRKIKTEDLRNYLSAYQSEGNVSKVTIDNIRRILSSFFAWLEDEDYIIKSPVRRIHKVKTGMVVKETYSDESLEIMRDACTNIRDLALIDILTSTGMRVGELVNLNIGDIDFENRECVVLGKVG